MNKIKQELRQKLQGQLSDEKTELDVDNAYSVVKENSVLFSLFCAENTINYYKDEDVWRMKVLKPTFKTTDELFKIFENENN